MLLGTCCHRRLASMLTARGQDFNTQCPWAPVVTVSTYLWSFLAMRLQCSVSLDTCCYITYLVGLEDSQVFQCAVLLGTCCHCRIVNTIWDRISVFQYPVPLGTCCHDRAAHHLRRLPTVISILSALRHLLSRPRAEWILCSPSSFNTQCP